MNVNKGKRYSQKAAGCLYAFAAQRKHTWCVLTVESLKSTSVWKSFQDIKQASTNWSLRALYQQSRQSVIQVESGLTDARYDV